VIVGGSNNARGINFCLNTFLNDCKKGPGTPPRPAPRGACPHLPPCYATGGTDLEGASAYSYFLQSFKTRIKQKFDQSTGIRIKMRIFEKKNCKNCLNVGASKDPVWLLTLSYYNFVEFISSAECVLLHSKKNKIAAVNVLLLLLPQFCIYFSLQTL